MTRVFMPSWKWTCPRKKTDFKKIDLIVLVMVYLVFKRVKYHFLVLVNKKITISIIFA